VKKTAATLTPDYISFSTPDQDLAGLIQKSTPPDGVTVEVTHGGLQCATPVQIVSEVFINFVRDGHDLIVGILAAWLYDVLKNHGRKTIRVNRRKVSIKQKQLRFCIDQILADQRLREAQWREAQGRKRVAIGSLVPTARNATEIADKLRANITKPVTLHWKTSKEIRGIVRSLGSRDDGIQVVFTDLATGQDDIVSVNKLAAVIADGETVKPAARGKRQRRRK
jgi:hypothetical protein